MKTRFKWLIGLSGGIAVAAVIAVILVPRLVDVQKFKPELERRIQDAVGRPVSLDGDISLAVFPWTALQLSEVHVRNPAGFEERDFVHVKSFELKIKPLPLLRGEVQVLSLSMEKPQIILERNREGRGNWEGSRGKTEPHQSGRGLGGITAEKISIADGTIVYIDQTSGKRREISDVQLHLKDLSLHRPFDIAFSAKVEGKPVPVPVSLDGKVGPLGNEPGRGIMPLDLTFRGPEKLELNVKGSLTNPTVKPEFDMVVRMSPFSPRKVLAALGQTDLLPPNVLENLALDTHVTGGREVLTLADGKLDFDDSRAAFSAVIKRVSGTDVTFSLKLDGIDLDRYLPPATEGATKAKGTSAPGIEAASTRASRDMDNKPPERIHLSGAVEIAKFKTQGVQTQDVKLNIQGENGVYKVDPLDLKLYQGTVSGRVTMDMRRDIPVSEISLQANGLQVGPLLRDLMKKESLTGTMRAQASLRMEGSRREEIERTLSGKGDITVRNGALKGVSLWGLVKKVDSALSLGQAAGLSSQTEFSELHIPFTLNAGNIDTKNATLVSTHLTARASGSANLTRQTLNFRIEPKVAAPLKSLGIGRIGGSPEITVPVLVRGTFSSPEFVPDMRGAVQETVKGEVQKLYEQGTAGSLGGKAKGLLKGVPF